MAKIDYEARYTQMAEDKLKFNKLTLEKYVGRLPLGKSGNIPHFLCKCDCGREKVVPYNYLKTGSTKSCGMCKTDHWLHKRYGFLEVVGIVHKAYVDESGKTHPIRLKCKCDCGNEIEAFSTALSAGKTISCGCIKRRGGKANLSIEQRKEIFNDTLKLCSAEERLFINFVSKHTEIFNDRTKLTQLIHLGKQKNIYKYDEISYKNE